MRTQLVSALVATAMLLLAPQPARGQRQKVFLPKRAKRAPDLPLSSAPPALPKRFEVHVVSGYEAGSTVKVVVDRPGKDVVLVLGMYERKPTWQVEATRRTRLRRVIVGLRGDTKRSRVTSTRRLTVVAGTGLRYATSTDSINFVRFVAHLKCTLGVERVSSFFGAYTLPREVRVDQVEKRDELRLDYPKAQRPGVNPRFTLLRRNGSTPWTARGPKRGKPGVYLQPRLVAVDRSGRLIMLSKDREALALQLKGKRQKIALPSSFPELSWPFGVAWLPKQKLALIGTFGGEGYLYRYNLAKKRWVDARSLNNADYTSMAADPLTGGLVALPQWRGSSWSRATYHLLSAEGIVQRRRRMPRLPGYFRLFDPGNGSGPKLSLIATKKALVLIAFAGGRWGGSGPKAVRRIWVVDRNSNSAVLSYKRPEKLRCRPRPY